MQPTPPTCSSQLHFQYQQARSQLDELENEYFDTFLLENEAHAALSQWFASDPDVDQQELNGLVREVDGAHSRLMSLDEQLNDRHEQLEMIFQQLKDATYREFVQDCNLIPFCRFFLYAQATSKRKLDAKRRKLRHLSTQSRLAHKAMGDLVLLFAGMRLLNAESALAQSQVRNPTTAQGSKEPHLVQVIEDAQRRLDEIKQQLGSERV